METIMKGIRWVASFFGIDTSIPDVVNHDMSSYDETDHTDLWDQGLSPLVDDEEAF